MNDDSWSLETLNDRGIRNYSQEAVTLSTRDLIYNIDRDFTDPARWNNKFALPLIQNEYLFNKKKEKKGDDYNHDSFYQRSSDRRNSKFLTEGASPREFMPICLDSSHERQPGLHARISLLICALVIRAACVAASPNFVFPGHERVIPR